MDTQGSGHGGRGSSLLGLGLGGLGVVLVLVGANTGRASVPHTAVAAPAISTPSAEAMLTAGRRVLRVPFDSSASPVGMRPGAEVDVLAAVLDTQAAGGGRVERVATGRVVSASGSSLALEVDAATADRLLWAEAFAKSLQILVRPDGEPSP